MDVVELKYLRKYIPFISYLLKNCGEQNPKLKEMMGWINDNKRFKRKIANLIEESVKVQYTKQLSNKNLPQWIHDLFKDKIEMIDLESSDDDSDIVIIQEVTNLETSDVDSDIFITPEVSKDTTKESGKSYKDGSIDNSSQKAIDSINDAETCDENKEIIFKSPSVLLKKMTPKFLEKYKININNELNKESIPLNVELIEGHKETHLDLAKASKGESKRPSAQIFLTNTDIDMTEQNTSICIICYSKPQNLTNHFVRVHKVESYVSRLREEILNELHENLRLARNVEQDSQEETHYTVVCAFCNETIQDSFLNFYNHFSSHTGEYGFYCSFCKLKKPYLEDMISHLKRSKVCSLAKILTAYVYNNRETKILLFRCKMCNFVQLNAANIEKHLVDHHGSHYESSSIGKYIIAAIDTREDIQTAAEGPQQEKSIEPNKAVEEDLITTINAAVEENLTPSIEVGVDDEYFTSLMLKADDLKIEVED